MPSSISPTPLPRLLLAAPRSGSGKTTVVCALLQALKDRGLSPAAFKSGPDYIVIILFPFRYGICEVTSHMCPARASFDIRQIVITLVSISLQISLNPCRKDAAWNFALVSV